MKRRSTRTRSLFLAAVMAIAILPTATVSQGKTTQEKLEEAQQQQEQLQSSIDDSKSNLASLQGSRNNLQEELNTLDVQLQEVNANLEALDAQIADKETEIEQTKEALAQAEAVEQAQYESMLERIRFMYENGEMTYLELLFSAKNFADFLNKSEFIEQIEAYDRAKLQEYKDTVAYIESEQARLETEMVELEQLKADAISEQERVNELVASTSEKIASYADQISDTEAQMIAYEQALQSKNDDIKALQAQLAEEKRLAELAAMSATRDISEVVFAEGDRYLLANLIYCEAGGEPYAGKVAVGAVVINRLLSSVFPNTIEGVIYAKRQFSPVASGRLALALAQNKANADCYRAADEAMAGVTNVGGCLFFRTPIEGIDPKFRIGGHIFY